MISANARNSHVCNDLPLYTVAVWPENPFSLLLTRPQGPQGCQMKRNHSLNMPLEVWCAKIDPKLNKLEKTIKIELNSSKMSVF